MTTENTSAPTQAEHDTAMAAAFDAAQARVQGATTAPAAETSAERPSWLPEGFDTPEDFRTAYDALQTSKQEAPAPETATPEQAAEVAASAGIDYDAVANEFMESGALSAATYDDLASKGIPKPMVDAYIAGQQAVADQIQNDIYGTVGGLDSYRAMTAWAGANLTEGEITAFDRAVTSDNVDTVRMAVASLKARYADANGSEPNLLGGGNGENLEVFRSAAELTAAMRDPRYAKDRAYRADVEAKLDRSKSVF